MNTAEACVARTEERPRFQVVDGVGRRPHIARSVRVHLNGDLRPGEGVDLYFESGQVVRLLREGPRDLRGALPRAVLGHRYRLMRTPGAVPEAGYHGQEIPARVAVDGEGPLRLHPVTWQDRPGRGAAPPPPELARELVIGGRTIRVHLPRAYLEIGGRFPVVLALDGQNLFDPATAYGGVDWALDRVARRLEKDGAPPCIVVGVDHAGSERLKEYSCHPDPSEEKGGGAEGHLDWLLTEVMERVAAEYPAARTPPALIGSSMGGHLGLFAALRFPGRFSGIGALSPTITWGGEILLRTPRRRGALPRVWLDTGDREHAVARWAHAAMRGHLERHGWTLGEDLRAEVIPGAAHHESAWSDRVGEVLRFLLAA